jgi:hypothetical protein
LLNIVVVRAVLQQLQLGLVHQNETFVDGRLLYHLRCRVLAQQPAAHTAGHQEPWAALRSHHLALQEHGQ